MTYLQFIMGIGNPIVDGIYFPLYFENHKEFVQYIKSNHLTYLRYEELPALTLESTFAEKDEEIKKILNEASADTSIVEVLHKGSRLFPTSMRRYVADVTPIKFNLNENFIKMSGISMKLSDY